MVFYSLCLSGLIWQGTQISVNYFTFDTIKDIKVSMPSETDNSGRRLNICFRNDEVLNMNRFIEYIYSQNVTNRDYIDNIWSKQAFLEKMSASNRFNVSYSPSELFSSFIGRKLRKESTETTKKFILGSRICYQIAYTGVLTLDKHNIKNATNVFISVGEALPIFDYNKLLPVSRVSGMLSKLTICSHYYTLVRMSWPYVDDCKDYMALKVSNRLRAVGCCINDGTVSVSTSSIQTKVITSNNMGDGKGIAFDRTLKSEFLLNCSRKYPKPDCNETTYLFITRREQHKTTDNHTMIDIRIGDDINPSFLITSKPRIDDIEYVTYILGAFGSWLGFSFLMLNPVPYMIVIENNRASSESTPKTNEIKRFKNRMLVLEHSRYRHEDQFLEMRNIMDAQKVIIDSLKLTQRKLANEVQLLRNNE